jgi:hypothetical protein
MTGGIDPLRPPRRDVDYELEEESADFQKYVEDREKFTEIIKDQEKEKEAYDKEALEQEVQRRAAEKSAKERALKNEEALDNLEEESSLGEEEVAEEKSPLQKKSVDKKRAPQKSTLNKKSKSKVPFQEHSFFSEVKPKYHKLKSPFEAYSERPHKKHQEKKKPSEKSRPSAQEKHNQKKPDQADQLPISNVEAFSEVSQKPEIQENKHETDLQMLKLASLIMEDAELLKKGDVTETKITLNMPGSSFDESEVIVSTYQFRPFELNIKFGNLNTNAKNIVAKNKNTLQNKLKEKKIIVHQIITE